MEKEVYEYWQLIFAGVVALSTVVYAILTATLVTESRKTRALQIAPNISIYLEEGEADITFLYIVFENIGFGVAKNVSFRIVKDLDFYSNEYNQISTKGIIDKGLKYFYPNQKFRYILTHRPSIPEENRNDSLEIEVKYDNILGKSESRVFKISLNEFDGTSQLTPPITYFGRISYELNEMRKLLKDISKK